MTDYSGNENPFFIPAFFTMILPVLIVSTGKLAADYMDTGTLVLLLLLVIIVILFAAIILSVTGIVTALNHQKHLIGCVFCLVISILEMILVLLVWEAIFTPARMPTNPVTTIVPHTTGISEIER